MAEQKKQDDSLDILTDDDHSLMERKSSKYSKLTIKRAFIVWMHTGQINKFEDVCKYYHQLEALEDTLPTDQKEQSRRHELDMFTNPPPASECQKKMFPTLYSDVDPLHIEMFETMEKEQRVFSFDTFKAILRQKDVTIEDVQRERAQNNLRMHSKARMMTMKKFLENLKAYAAKYESSKTVANKVSSDIKKGIVESDLDIEQTLPVSFDFLDAEPTPIDDSEKNNNKVNMNKANAEINTEINICKPKPIKSIYVTTSKTAELNDSCAEFFKCFNARQIQKSWTLDKTVSLLPLPEFDKIIRKDKDKSKSAECLLQSNNIIGSQNVDFFSQFMKSSEKKSKVNLTSIM